MTTKMKRLYLVGKFSFIELTRPIGTVHTFHDKRVNRFVYVIEWIKVLRKNGFFK